MNTRLSGPPLANMISCQGKVESVVSISGNPRKDSRHRDSECFFSPLGGLHHVIQRGFGAPPSHFSRSTSSPSSNKHSVSRLGRTFFEQRSKVYNAESQRAGHANAKLKLSLNPGVYHLLPEPCCHIMFPRGPRSATDLPPTQNSASIADVL